ncbi:MAG: esterase/lipase family protein [Bradymonadia bacterium]
MATSSECHLLGFSVLMFLSFAACDSPSPARAPAPEPTDARVTSASSDSQTNLMEDASLESMDAFNRTQSDSSAPLPFDIGPQTADADTSDATLDEPTDASSADASDIAPDARMERGCQPDRNACAMLPSRLPNSRTNNPIVFVHGMGGFENLGPWDYFYGVPAQLREAGYETYITVSDPFNTSLIRSQQLRPQLDLIRDCACANRLNIIAHSQGGIDMRLLISDGGYGRHIASLTTISTPHRGTQVADALLGLTDGPVQGIADGLLNVFSGFVWDDQQEDPDIAAAMQTCSTQAMQRFNEVMLDDPDVQYFSYAGFSGRLADGRPECLGGELPIPRRGDTIAPEFATSFLYLGGILRANDGLVPVESAKWGRFRGCLPADHLDQIGQLGGLVDTFNYREFYEEHAAFLVDEGL